MTKLCMTTQEGVAIDDCDSSLKNVLIVDADQPFLFNLVKRVKKKNECVNVYTAANGLQARAILSTIPVDLVISGLHMPFMDGLELAAWLAEARPQVPAIIMSAYAELETITAINKKGFYFLQKPLDYQDLFRTIQPLLYGQRGENGTMISRSFFPAQD